MKTEIYIENNRADVSTEIAALLNFSIDDVKDFSSRSTTWSKTIVLPGTSTNNKIFGHIFQVGQSNEYDPSQPNVGYNFNASQSADVIIFQDQIQTFKGILRLLQINYIKGRIEYEVSVFGKLAGLNVALSSGLLEDLDFSAYNHIYNDANIVASWDNPGGAGYYYPLIDYGTYSTNKHDWDIRTFRPALYVKEYLDKMFKAADYRYDGDLFETERFSKLVVPHNSKILTSNKIELGKGSITNTQHYTFLHTGGEIYQIPFDTYIGTGFTADALKQTFTYAGTISTNVVVEGSFDVNFFGVAFFYSVSLHIYKNGRTGTELYNVPWIFTPTTVLFNVNVSMAPGDTIEFWFDGTADQLNITGASVTFKVASGLMAIPIIVGDQVEVNTTIPKNVRQIDFLVSIVKMFNLYVYEDRLDPSLIHFKPYINFYQNAHNSALDWTYKLDRDQAIKVKPMSELTAKIYNFKFKSDSDYYNDLYRKRYNEGYGDRVYDSQFEFTDQTKAFEVVFSATPLVGYGGEEKVYSTIFKRTGSQPPYIEENTDSNIRILQTKKITGLSVSWQIKDGDTVLNTLTRYGYAGHLNDPDVPSDDLNFGATRELFFELTTGVLSNNQFNVYWSGYMAEITDKDSKLLTGNFYLNPADIATLDFSKYVYLDGGLFRLNAINNYNASKPATCMVELLKVNKPNFTLAAPPEGPPDGNFLLWTDDNTLDFDDGVGNELLYRSNDSVLVNWTYSDSAHGIGAIGIFRIRLNASVFPTVNQVNASGSGSLSIVPGDIVKVEVMGNISITKGLIVDSDIDGNLYTSGSTLSNKTFTFTAQEGRVYTITGSTT